MRRLLVGFALVVGLAGRASPRPGDESWFFAISGDSRDCGDVIMPRIARAIEDRRAQAPVKFYWHLGDFRRIADVDCDIAKRADPSYDCVHRPPADPSERERYAAAAWNDFLARQIAPFGALPVYLGIGNHELLGGHTREEFKRVFRSQLTRAPIENSPVETWYHWAQNGVDFLSLDNSTVAFPPEEIAWLAHRLEADAKDDGIRAIVVGMHAALPFSTWRNHATDTTCAGRCSGSQVYDLLERAQNLSGPPGKRKKVYAFASHSHFYQENIYDTPEHAGRVLPGWIIGTAGAEQFSQTIRYGYLEVEVHPDGSIQPRFREVRRDSAPLLTGPEAALLTDFCFRDNRRGYRTDDEWKGDCTCGTER